MNSRKDDGIELKYKEEGRFDRYSICFLAAGNNKAELGILCFHKGHFVH